MNTSLENWQSNLWIYHHISIASRYRCKKINNSRQQSCY